MDIKRFSLREQVYDGIKNKILNKEYKIGEYLNIQELTRELSVSNTPVREALSALVSDGLVDVSDNYKYKVVNLNEKEIIDLNQTILILILGALDYIKREDKFKLLENMLENSLANYKKDKDKNELFDYQFVRLSTDFDRQFVLATNNKFLIQEFDNLMNLFVLTSVYNKKEYRDIHVKEHYQMLESIRETNIDKTKNILKNHFSKNLSDMDY
ncbi:DNA-binding GntR family transcriptional regulator [Peptoniphilus olsenii]|uniref:DNA-binding GntR family transcriptional regulator n=1 Tax=Peptoniphilus olsenii TaxID=411570 RepID=A0ABV2J9T0_9FIRM